MFYPAAVQEPVGAERLAVPAPNRLPWTNRILSGQAANASRTCLSQPRVLKVMSSPQWHQDISLRDTGTSVPALGEELPRAMDEPDVGLLKPLAVFQESVSIVVEAD